MIYITNRILTFFTLFLSASIYAQEIKLSQKPYSNDSVIVKKRIVYNKNILDNNIESNNSNFNTGILSSFDELINGRLSGLNIIKNSGTPGTKTTSQIRGINNLISSNNILYVLDGVPIDNTPSNPPSSYSGLGVDSGIPNNSDINPLTFINFSDIESVELIKDQSSNAFYGGRAAGGVILITTKKGNFGKIKAKYNTYFGVSQLRKKIELFDASDLEEIYKSNNRKSFGNSNEDLYSKIFQNGFSQNHVISISGGRKNTSIYSSVGYYKQNGIIQKVGFDRINARINITQKFAKEKIILDLRYLKSIENHNQIPVSGTSYDFRGGVLAGLFKWNPQKSLIDNSGTYIQPNVSVPNPLALISYINDEFNINRNDLSLKGNAEVFKGFNIQALGSINMLTSNRYAYYSKKLINYQGLAGVGSIGEKSNFSYFFDYNFNYKKTFNKLILNLFGGYNQQSFEYNDNFKVYRNYKADIENNDDIPSGTDLTIPKVSNFGNKLMNSRYIGFKINQNDKLKLNATLRKDGSSVFNKNKYHLFPSVSISYLNVGEFKDDAFVNNINLRINWAILGNNNLPLNASKTILSQTGPVIFGNEYFQTYGISNLGNPNLKWETTNTTNFGIDFRIKNSILASIDLFNNNTKNGYYYVITPQPSQVPYIIDNVAEILNQGIELSVNVTNMEKSNLKWSTIYNYSFIKNELKKFQNNPQLNISSYAFSRGIRPIQILKESYTIGTYIVDPIQSTSVDKNGYTSPIYNQKDAITLATDPSQSSIKFGSGIPSWYGNIDNNIQFKNWDMKLYLNFSGGNKIFNNTAYVYSSLSNVLFNGYGSIKTNYNDPLEKVNSSFLENGAYLRISNLELGYSYIFKDKMISNIHPYISSQNLWVFTKYSGFDPEVSTQTNKNYTNSFSLDYLNYPNPRNFILGLKVEF